MGASAQSRPALGTTCWRWQPSRTEAPCTPGGFPNVGQSSPLAGHDTDGRELGRHRLRYKRAELLRAHDSLRIDEVRLGWSRHAEVDRQRSARIDQVRVASIPVALE